MRIRSDLNDTFYRKGFDSETDPFQKGDLAKRLTSLYKNLEHGTVSVLDGRWGSGKSVFARQWKRYLETQGAPCIYFDAFAADYVDSPFRAVATAFVRAAKDARVHDNATYDRFLSAASKAAKVIAAPAAKMAVKAVTLGLVGASEIEEIKVAAEEVASGLGDISESAAKAMLEEQADDEANFEALRKSLESLPSLLKRKMTVESQSEYDDDESPSLVVIVDELDRCRPDFALGVVEVLKHFFRADRVHFVLVTNLNHLLLSVQKRYGVGDAAGEYIQKFYDFVIPFEERKMHSRSSNASLHSQRLLSAMLKGSETRDASDLADYISGIIRAYDSSLRQAEQIVSNVLLAQIDFQKNTYRPAILVAFLAAVKAIDPSLFSDIKRSRVDSSKIQSFVKRGEWPHEMAEDRLIVILQYHSEAEIDQDDPRFKGYASSMWNYSFDDRLDILPFLANSVIDRFG